MNKPAPDFTLEAVQGGAVALTEVLRSQRALLVFLRHLG